MCVCVFVCVCAHVCLYLCVALYFHAGFELLYQPEVVRLYLSLLTESQNYNTLEAAAGALQNLSAGQWTVSAGLGSVQHTEALFCLTFLFLYCLFVCFVF